MCAGCIGGVGVGHEVDAERSQLGYEPSVRDLWGALAILRRRTGRKSGGRAEALTH